MQGVMDSHLMRYSIAELYAQMFSYVSLSRQSDASDTKSSVQKLTDIRDRSENERLARHYLDDYGNAMYRLAYSYIHNELDAEEIVQDAIINVLQKKISFEGEAHEKSYLLSTVANLSKNRIKYNQLRETEELSEELTGDNREDLRYIWDAVKQLPDQYREVIHLFYYEGYQAVEISKILGRKEATVRSDLSRGRNLLKTILKEEYDFE